MLYQKEITEIRKYDFLVCGGGMTGFACAIAAARKGVKTAIIEKTGNLGGVAVSCGVNHLLGGLKYRNETKKCEWFVGGIFKELADKLLSADAAIDPDTIDRKWNPHGWLESLADGIIFDIEKMKRILDEMCCEEKVDVYYFTDIVDVIVEEESLKCLVAHNKSGLLSFEADYFADATGDADIAAWSGCRTVLGRETDNLTAPASLEMHLDHVDTSELSDYIKKNNEPRFRKLILQLRERGIWNFPYEIFICVQGIREDTYMINTVRQTGINSIDGQSLSNAMSDGRKECFELFQILKEHFPGFANARLKFIAPMIGIRESRRIVGDYVLTVDDIRSGKFMSDSIALSAYGWDLPDPVKPSYQPMHEKKISKPEFIQIPYRSLLPDKIRNLIVAGRCISVERDVLGPVRVMAPCIAMGQAAGTAAYLAKDSAVSFKNIDVLRLQQILENDACRY